MKTWIKITALMLGYILGLLTFYLIDRDAQISISIIVIIACIVIAIFIVNQLDRLREITESDRIAIEAKKKDWEKVIVEVDGGTPDKPN